MNEVQNPEENKPELPVGFASTVADHDCFIIPDRTDIEKMKDEAYRRQQGDYYQKKSESTVIHLHRFTEPCDSAIDKHLIYPAIDLKSTEG